MGKTIFFLLILFTALIIGNAKNICSMKNGSLNNKVVKKNILSRQSNENDGNCLYYFII